MKLLWNAISNIVVLQDETSSCEAGIILLERDFINSTVQEDILNLSRVLLYEGYIPSPTHTLSDSPNAGRRGYDGK
jgi:hypothetical protein